MDEVSLAVEKWYLILEIYEVYEYQVAQYNRETREGLQFVDYINTFSKLKTEATGYPSWVLSTEDQERNVESFWTSECTQLEKETVRYNAAKRGIAKLSLDSMWGN